jgi:hypothetical protein
VDEYEIEIGPHPGDNVAVARCFVRHNHNVAERTDYPRPRTASSSRFEQRFELEAECTPPEWKGFDHDGIRPCRIEGSEKRLSPAFLQFLVDRLVTRADELFKARVASTDWRELNKALDLRRNGPRGRLSAQHQSHRDVFEGDSVN